MPEGRFGMIFLNKKCDLRAEAGPGDLVSA